MSASTNRQHAAHDRLSAGRRWIDAVEVFGEDQDLWRQPSWKRAAANNASDADEPRFAQRGRRVRASVLLRRTRR